MPTPHQREISKAVRRFLEDTQAYPKSAGCVKCGSRAGLLKIMVSLGDSPETWEISLPVCGMCFSQNAPEASMQ
jgi:hypothetical protein